MPIQIPVVQTGFEASIEAAARKAGRNLKIDLGASSKSINALSQPLGRITGQAHEFTKSMEAANARVLAFGASVGVLNSVMQAFKGIVTSTIEVQKSIMDINSILQKNSKDIAQFQKEIFNVARETGNSFKTVSEAALELSRQGLPANQVIGRLKDSMILARLSGLDAAQAVEGLTASINSFSKQGLTSSQVLNKISAAAAEFAVSERDLIEGFKRSASVAQQAGVSIDELGGIITAVQQKTARGGAVIGNSFKTIFTRIRRSESLELLSDIGIQVTDLQGKVLPASKLIEGLASKISTLNDVDVASITEKIGGGFQIAPLLAALDDYSSKTSVARKATETFLNASDQAYQRNTALNQAMAAAINEASINLKEFAVTLGEIGITKNLTNILTFFNSFISDVKNLLQGDGLGSDFAKGVVKGIGGVLSGPGLAVFAGIILKLTNDLVKFGTTSLKTFFNVGTAAKEINALQSTIANTLLRNKDIQDQILRLEGNRVAQAKFFTTALNQQLTTMERMKTIAASIAPTVYQGTAPTRRGITKTGAGGYMPAVSQETRDISRGVGGARAGDKPVVIPNFAFGGGKKGTMVAHTGEYVVPNFAKGGSAIFNRDMIASMGLPSGAQKIGAAGGFVPNFAVTEDQINAKIAQWRSSGNTGESAVKRVLNAKDPDPINKAAAERLLKEKEKAKTPLNQLIPINQDGREFGMIVGERGVSSPQTRFADNTGKTPTPTQTENSKYRIEVPVYRIQDEKLKFTEVPKLTEDISKLAATAALRLAKGLSGDKMPKPENKAYIEKTLNPGTLGGTAGTIFEAGIAGILNSNDFKDYEKIPRNSLIDFRGNFSDIRKLYNIPNGRAEIGVEAKGSSSADLVSSAAEKFLKVTMGEDPFSGQKRKKAANGYIPNFADPLKEAIGREISAGVPASQIYVDQNSSLKNPMNPMGLMVANRRDEPAGGMQGINRARKEGANPMLYGAAGGFVPNYAPQIGEVTRQDVGRTKINDQSIQDFNKSLNEISASLRKGSISFADAIGKVSQLSSSTGSTTAQVARLRTAGEGLVTAYNNELQARNARAQELKKERSEKRSNNNSSDTKSSRDLLGTVFALQAGLSFLTSATEGASSGLGKFTNGLSSVLSAATTASLVSQGLSGLAKEGSTASKILGKVGIYGAIAAGAFEAFKQVGSYLDSTNPAINKARDSMMRVSEAASKAALNLSNFNPAQKERIQNRRDALISGARKVETANLKPFSTTMTSRFGDSSGKLRDSLNNTVDQALAVGVSYDKMWNMIQESAKTGGEITADEVSKITQEIEKLINIAAQFKPEDFLKKFNLKAEEGMGKTLIGLSGDRLNTFLTGTGGESTKGNTDYLLQYRKKLTDDLSAIGVTEPEAQAEALKLIIGLVKQKGDATKTASEQASEAISQELKDTLKLLRVQEQIDKRKFGEEGLSKSAELAKQMASISIETNLGLSETQRARGIALLETEYSKLNKQLEITAKNQGELDKLMADTSEKTKLATTEFTAEQKGKIDQETRKIIETYGSTPKGQKTLSEAISTGSQDSLVADIQSIIKGDGGVFKGLGENAIFAQAIATSTANYYKTLQNNNSELQQSLYFIEKTSEANEKLKRIEEAKANIIRKTNYDLESRASALSARAGDISNKQSLLQAEKELEIAKYQKTSTATTVQEQAAELERINQKYFDLEMANEREKAILEARAELTRNLKVDDNTLKIGDNTTATTDLTILLQDHMLGVLRAMPENIKNAIIEARNALPGGVVGGDTQSSNDQTLNLGTNYDSNGTVVGNQKLEEIRNSIPKNTGNNADVSSVIKEESMVHLAQNAIKFLGDKASIKDNKLYINNKEAPAGMRNNNPANLIYNDPDTSKYFRSVATSINFDNVNKTNGGKGDRQLVFDDPLTGMEAAVKLALNKYLKKGLKTPNEIIADPQGWTGGNFEAAKNIANSMGVGPTQDLNLDNPVQLKKFIRVLLKQEQGDAGDLYSDDLISTAIQNELNRRGSTNQNPTPIQSSANGNQTGSGSIQANVDNKYGARDPNAVGRTRNESLTSSVQGRKLLNLLNSVSQKLGVEYDITSALQKPGTGEGYRHDNTVGAADIQLLRNNKPLSFNNPDDQVIMKEFVKNAVAGGATGVGAGLQYMGPNTMHIGYGSPAVWGGKTGSGYKPPNWLVDAFNEGRSANGYLPTSKALTAQQFGLTDTAEPEAQKIAQMEYEDMSKAAKEASKKILGAGESTEKIHKYAESLQQYATALRKNANTEATQRGIFGINEQKDRKAAEPGTFGAGFAEGMRSVNSEIDEFANKLGKSIPTSFADNMASAMEKIIMDGEDLGTTLRSAATSFLNEITKANLKNLANIFTSGAQSAGSSIFSAFTQKASGGAITGGSGKKDDVPALLMGGEFVMNKKAVSKYGMNFMNQLNSGTLGRFASGGSVNAEDIGKYTIFQGKGGSNIANQYENVDNIPIQKASDSGFYSPGMYGAGTISGRQDLLSFATQSTTSGKNDEIFNANNMASVSLEPESARLTVKGKLENPEWQAVQKDKEEAFNLYLQELDQEKQLEEQEKERRRAFRKAYQSAIWSAVLNAAGTAFVQPAIQGFNAGMGQAASQGQTGLSAIGSGFKGMWSGGNIGGTQIGGLSNVFSGNYQLASIGNIKQLNALYESNPNSDLGKLIASNANNYISNISVPKAIPVNRATGGLIPNASGTDTVPAMLSGGEFVMNRAATQNIGAGALQSLNAGSTSEVSSAESSDKIVSKLDELITAVKENMTGNISVNVSSNEGSNKQESTQSNNTSNNSQQNTALTKKIRAAVLEVIQQEKRLGGSLRFS